MPQNPENPMMRLDVASIKEALQAHRQAAERDPRKSVRQEALTEYRALLAQVLRDPGYDLDTKKQMLEEETSSSGDFLGEEVFDEWVDEPGACDELWQALLLSSRTAQGPSGILAQEPFDMLRSAAVVDDHPQGETFGLELSFARQFFRHHLLPLLQQADEDPDHVVIKTLLDCIEDDDRELFSSILQDHMLEVLSDQYAIAKSDASARLMLETLCGHSSALLFDITKHFVQQQAKRAETSKSLSHDQQDLLEIKQWLAMFRKARKSQDPKEREQADQDYEALLRDVMSDDRYQPFLSEILTDQMSDDPELEAEHTAAFTPSSLSKKDYQQAMLGHVKQNLRSWRVVCLEHKDIKEQLEGLRGYQESLAALLEHPEHDKSYIIEALNEEMDEARGFLRQDIFAKANDSLWGGLMLAIGRDDGVLIELEARLGMDLRQTFALHFVRKHIKDVLTRPNHARQTAVHALLQALKKGDEKQFKTLLEAYLIAVYQVGNEQDDIWLKPGAQCLCDAVGAYLSARQAMLSDATSTRLKSRQPKPVAQIEQPGLVFSVENEDEQVFCMAGIGMDAPEAIPMHTQEADDVDVADVENDAAEDRALDVLGVMNAHHSDRTGLDDGEEESKGDVADPAVVPEEKRILQPHLDVQGSGGGSKPFSVQPVAIWLRERLTASAQDRETIFRLFANKAPDRWQQLQAMAKVALGGDAQVSQKVLGLEPNQVDETFVRGLFVDEGVESEEVLDEHVCRFVVEKQGWSEHSIKSLHQVVSDYQSGIEEDHPWHWRTPADRAKGFQVGQDQVRVWISACGRSLPPGRHFWLQQGEHVDDTTYANTLHGLLQSALQEQVASPLILKDRVGQVIWDSRQSDIASLVKWLDSVSYDSQSDMLDLARHLTASQKRIVQSLNGPERMAFSQPESSWQLSLEDASESFVLREKRLWGASVKADKRLVRRQVSRDGSVIKPVSGAGD